MVTDGTGNFYGSRTLVQALHDHGDFEDITAFGSSTADAKKMLISRQARYSGLIDVLKFAEGGDSEFAGALQGKTTWVVVNADATALPAQIAAAKNAGISRVFIHLCAADAAPDDAALTSTLESSGMTYTLMRTGSFGKSGGGGGLAVNAIDTPTCEEIPIEDAFRFLVESLSLEEANGRAFSLCTSTDADQLKAMRMAGCTRREEVAALLRGEVEERDPDETRDQATVMTTAFPKQTDEERREELASIFAKAKKEGEIRRKQMAYEEEEKKLKRAEIDRKYGARRRTPETKDDEEDGESTRDAEKETKAEVSATPAPTPEDGGNVPAPLR